MSFVIKRNSSLWAVLEIKSKNCFTLILVSKIRARHKPYSNIRGLVVQNFPVTLKINRPTDGATLHNIERTRFLHPISHTKYQLITWKMANKVYRSLTASTLHGMIHSFTRLFKMKLPGGSLILVASASSV